MTQVTKPVPQVAPWSVPFWDATRKEKLKLQCCKACDKFVFYPRYACPHCGEDALEWQQVSGRGTLYTFTVVESNAPSSFTADMPYVVAVVVLDEGPRMLTNIVGCDPADLSFDMPVEVVFEKLDDEFTLPKFRPLQG